MPREVLFGALGFLVVGGVFAAVEAALTALSGPVARLDRRFVRWYEHRRRVRATLWSGLMFCRVGTGVLVYGVAAALTGGRAAVLVVLVAAFVAILVVEMVARLIGRMFPERIAAAGLLALRPIELLLTPVVVPLEKLLPRLRGPTTKAEAKGEEVKRFLEEGGAAATRESEELISAILEFRDTTAKEVLVPRTHTVTLDADSSLAEAVRLAKTRGHSRIPVVKDRTDNIIGILHVKDLLGYVTEPPPPGWTVESVVRKPVLFVPETQKLSRLLKDMRSQGMHLAMVVDEFGGTSGIVTLEDILEEIVGEIRDEYDADEGPIVRVDDRTFLVDASISIYDLGDAIGVPFPDDGDYESLGGFLTARAGRVPETGAVLRWNGLTLTVRAADERCVEKVEIRLEERQRRAG